MTANKPPPMIGPAGCDGHGKTTCDARTRRGTQCLRPAGWGTSHPGVGRCKFHGGSTPSHVKRAEAVMLERRIGTMIAEELHDPAVVDLTAGMLEVVVRSGARYRVFSRLLEELAPVGSSAYVITGEGAGVDYVPHGDAGVFGPDHKGDAKPHVLVGMVNDAEDRYLRALKAAGDYGIDQRRIEMAEGQARQGADMLLAGMAGLLARLVELGGDRRLVRALEQEVPGLLRQAIDSVRAIEVKEA